MIAFFCDILGGYHTVSLSGVHYFLTIVDEHGWVTCWYLMHFRSKTLTCLSAFFSMVHTQFYSKICHVHIDNCQEFLAWNTQDFFSEQGTLHEHTCVETPPTEWYCWAEIPPYRKCSSVSTFSRTHFPYRWDNAFSQPHISSTLLPRPLSKYFPFWAPLSQPTLLWPLTCVRLPMLCSLQFFFEYLSSYSAYWVYDLDGKKIIISRDVTFIEHVYPFKLQPQPSPSSLVLPLPILGLLIH